MLITLLEFKFCEVRFVTDQNVLYIHRNREVELVLKSLITCYIEEHAE